MGESSEGWGCKGDTERKRVRSKELVKRRFQKGSESEDRKERKSETHVRETVGGIKK